ncbi:hypothetical protein DMC25_26710 [Caulobacter sp. D4A]|uniref:J domain-containing protein n=1 Tax=unclassified Caulobacter TaxID=2648921 RepID=UPI000D73CA02|nr:MULTISPECIES: J domain-containing protein [unclassified Caulobacter]PXA71358.1 hypothetical protein DMC25_26710 [Caulobacter sp. D4A]PXA87697.1 hypothetical protein DMC18_20435 [Caulobacter sp. D5]
MSGFVDDGDDIWAVLGVEPTRDRDVIRRAYARKLRVTNPEDDAEAFMRLREAHDEAIQRAQWDWMWDDESEEEDGSEGDEAADAAVASPEFKLVIEPGALTTLLEGRPTAPAAPPPPLPDASTHEAEELRARFDRLEALLGGQDRPAPAELTAAFHAVLNAEALDEIAVADAVEARIADLLLRTAPRSDPLLAPAIEAFRWRRTDLRFEPGPTVEAVIERCDFVEGRDRMLALDTHARAVMEVLQGPPTAKVPLMRRLNPGFEIAMRDMLGRIGDGDGALMADFDAATVALWRQRYARPRLTSGMLWFTALAPLLAPLIAGGYGLPIPAVLETYVAATAAVLAVQLFYLQGYLRLKTAWETHRSWRAGVLERVGWAPLSLALLPASALLPDTLWSAVIAAGVVTPVLVWTFVTTGPPSPLTHPLHQRLLAQVVPFAWVLSLPMFDVDDAVTQPMIVALAAAAAVDFRGGALSSQVWHLEIGKIARVVGTLALLAAAIAIGALAWRMVGETPPAWAPLCVAAVLALAIGHRAPVAVLGEDIAKMRYYGMFALFWISRGFNALVGSWLVTSAIWMLIGMAIGLILSLAIEVRDRTR